MSNMKNRVLELLEEREISIKEFCEKANLRKNAIYDLDHNYPNLANAIKMADALQVSLDYLVENTDEEVFVKAKHTNFNFYEKVENLLQSGNKSKRQMCEDLGLSRDAYTRWKRGAVPYFSTIVSIAKYFDVTVDYLVGRSDSY